MDTPRLKRRAVTALPPEGAPCLAEALANDTDYLCLVMELVWAARAKRECETLDCEGRLTAWIEGYVDQRIRSGRNPARN